MTTINESEKKKDRRRTEDVAEKEPEKRLVKKASLQHEKLGIGAFEKSDMLERQNYIEILQQEVYALRLQEIEQKQRQIANGKKQNDFGKTEISHQDPDKCRMLLPPLPNFSATASLKLNEITGTLTLIVQASIELDTIAICPDFPLDITTVSSQQLSEVNGQFGKYTFENKSDQLYQRAAYQFRKSGAKSAEFQVCVEEGQQGRIHLYIIPKSFGALEVIAQDIDVFVKPLSLHMRHHYLVGDTVHESSNMNSLKLDGDFTVTEIHTWLMKCLPDVPYRAPSMDSTATYHFRSIMLDARVACHCRSGEAVFYAENPSVVSILRDALTKEATANKRTMNIANNFNPATVLDIVTKVAKRLESIRNLKFEARLLTGLKELQGAEPDLSFLPPEWTGLLSRAFESEAKLTEELAQEKKLHAVLIRLRTDVFHFKGKQDTPSLKGFLENWNLQVENGNVVNDQVELKDILMSFYV